MEPSGEPSGGEPEPEVGGEPVGDEAVARYRVRRAFALDRLLARRAATNADLGPSVVQAEDDGN